MRHLIHKLGFLFSVSTAMTAGGQAPAPAPAIQPPAAELQRANALYAQGDYVGAAQAFQSLADRFPTHQLTRLRLGVAQMELKRLVEAEANIREAERLNNPAPQASFRLGQVMAEQHKPDSAIAALLRAAAARLPVTAPQLDTNTHLASLKGHAKWPAVVDAFDSWSRPCLHDPKAREFDFWIGDWDVRSTGLPPVGPAARNTITLDDNGCVLTEHWSAPSGSEGQSFNLYERSFGEWRQTWVDNSGGEHDYRGGIKDGNMVYEGTVPAPGGQRGRVPTRLTFFRIGPDSVRQFSESSADSGRTWQANYDFMYVRRKSGVAAASAPLTDADRAAIRAVDSAFVRGWLRDDTTAVLSVFGADAVLMPPGAAPLTGLAAIRAYWWPVDGTHTRITAFDRTIDEIGGSRDLAFLRGTGAVSWSMTKGGKTSTQKSRSSDLLLLTRDVAGRWHVVRQMWSALP